MKFLNKTVISTDPPSDTSLLWLKPRNTEIANSAYSLYAFNHGKWSSVAETEENEDTLLWFLTDNKPVTYTVDGVEYTKSTEIKHYVKNTYSIDTPSCKQDIIEIKKLPKGKVPHPFIGFQKLRFINNIDIIAVPNLFDGSDKIVDYRNCKITIDKDAVNLFESNQFMTHLPHLFITAPSSLENLCRQCFSLVCMPNIDYSKVTNFNSSFYYCTSLKYVPDLNIASATNLRNMFAATPITSAPYLSNTGNVTNTTNMYRDTNIISFDTNHIDNPASLVNAGFMFQGSKLERVGDLDWANCVDWLYMFENNRNLITIDRLNMSSAISTSNMFSKCTSLANIGSLYGLKVTTNFTDCPLTGVSILNIFNTIAKVTKTTYLQLGNINLNKVTDSQKLIAINKGWTLT